MNGLLNIIGLMSGTSLDGLDIAYCSFREKNGAWDYNVKQCETIYYTDEFRNMLKEAFYACGERLIKIENEFTSFLIKNVEEFISKHSIKKIDAIASHGHTVFHKPDLNYTLQIGNGVKMAANLKLPIIYDFRKLDVALNGHGAPLVPVADHFLFSGYDYCLNLGGFSNISYLKDGKRIAYDISPVNIVVNSLVNKVGLNMDEKGNLGKSGKVISSLLSEMNSLEYYSLEGPKSLGKEWVDESFMPFFEKLSGNLEDILATYYEHVAIQIGKALKPGGRVLVSGGGAYNTYLINRIKGLSKAEIIIPDKKIIDFKEAISFAFLGVLKIKGQINCFSSVTGADRDSSSGIYVEP